MIDDLSLSPSFERSMKTIPVDRDPLLRLFEPHDVLYLDDHRLLADHAVDERAVLVPPLGVYQVGLAPEPQLLRLRWVFSASLAFSTIILATSLACCGVKNVSGPGVIITTCPPRVMPMVICPCCGATFSFSTASGFISYQTPYISPPSSPSTRLDDGEARSFLYRL